MRVRRQLHVRRSLGFTSAVVPKTVDELLNEARATFDRVTPRQAHDELLGGALLIDTRTSQQLIEHGRIPGAIEIGLNVLEWRLDPSSDSHLLQATDHDVRAIVLCQQGYSSSLAAARLQALGLHRATDVIGGFEAWRDAGLPVERAQP
jgi:rhodanese-related sulfurtransferase